MITIFFNETGFYIEGGGIENAWSCRPAVSEAGLPIFPPTHHMYGVLERALRNVQNASSAENIAVYNDSRVIEEINGNAEPLDDVCRRWCDVIRQQRLPDIKPVVYFRKKSPDFISDNITRGHLALIHSVDRKQRDRSLKAQAISLAKQRTTRQQSAVNRFRQTWFQTEVPSPK